jgi:hypothetical protein
MSRKLNETPNPAQEVNEEEKIPIDGFRQIVEMLKVADPAFRDSLLKRLATRDSSLAASLKRDLSHR